MNIISKVRILLDLNESNYIDLAYVLKNSDKNNEFVFAYIMDKFSYRPHAICSWVLASILGSMDDKYVVKTIDNLINEPNFSHRGLRTFLEDKKLNSAIKNNRTKYLTHYVDTLDFVNILNLYNHKNITEEDKKTIECCLYDKISNAKNAYNLAFAQQITGNEIVSKCDIENAILNSCYAKYIYELMGLNYYDKKKLIIKLSEIKEENTENKKYFLLAIAEHYPGDISKIPFGEFIEEIINSGLTKEDNAMIITKASNAIAVMQSEKKEAVSYFDDEQAKTVNTKKYNYLY